MPAVLCAKLGEVDTVANRGKYTVSVIGCEEQGVLCAVAFAEAGYKVVCADAGGRRRLLSVTWRLR